MSWLRRIWLLMLVLGTLVSPRLASAQAPLGLETRVGGLDLAAQVIVGVHDLASPGSYLGNPDGYDEDASGCSLAARGIGLRVKNTATALRSASEAYKGTTRLGHALSKHAGRNPDIWGKVTGNASTWHNQALQHFRDILRGPGSFQRVTNSKGTTFLEKMLPDGRGVRLQLDYRFKGFID